MVATVREYLESLRDIFKRDGDERVFMGRNRNLKMLNAVLIQELYILGRVFLGYQGPFEQLAHVSLVPKVQNVQNGPQSERFEMLEITNPREAAAINPGGNLSEVWSWTDRWRRWLAFLDAAYGGECCHAQVRSIVKLSRYP